MLFLVSQEQQIIDYATQEGSAKKDHRLAILRSRALGKLNDHAGAQRVLQYHNFNNGPDTRLAYAEYLIDTGKFGEAIHCLANQNPEQGWILRKGLEGNKNAEMALAQALAATGDLQAVHKLTEVLGNKRTVLSPDFNSPRYCILAARLYLAAGEPRTALDLITQEDGLKLLPDLEILPLAHEIRGEALIAMGRKNQALTLWNGRILSVPQDNRIRRSIRKHQGNGAQPSSHDNGSMDIQLGKLLAELEVKAIETRAIMKNIQKLRELQVTLRLISKL